MMGRPEIQPNEPDELPEVPERHEHETQPGVIPYPEIEPEPSPLVPDLPGPTPDLPFGPEALKS